MLSCGFGHMARDYDEFLSTQTQAKNVIEYFFGESFEGFDRLLYDVLTEIWDDTT